MTFSAIVVSHSNVKGLRNMLGQLKYQTRPPDETIVLCSDTPDVMRLREEFQDVEFLERPNRDDWGHEKRAEGLERATGDWVGFFNDDDSYAREYLERMLELARRYVLYEHPAGVVFCDWDIQLDDNGFRLGHSTSGNFIVRREVALKAGYTDLVYEADGLFIDRVAALTRTVHVPHRLYWHNKQ